VAQIIQSALLRHLDNEVEVQDPQNQKKALASAKAGKFQYLFYPTILHWEDRATEWSGKRDNVSVKLLIIEAFTSERISSVTIDGTGNSGIASNVGERPEDLLSKPISKYVDQLF
jgi:hypothetical protein